jgi:hypothetical protein
MIGVRSPKTYDGTGFLVDGFLNIKLKFIPFITAYNGM